jgi:hypothetical protein
VSFAHGVVVDQSPVAAAGLIATYSRLANMETSRSLKRKKAERSSASHSVILGHSSVLGTGIPAPLPGIVTSDDCVPLFERPHCLETFKF